MSSDQISKVTDNICIPDLVRETMFSTTPKEISQGSIHSIHPEFESPFIRDYRKMTPKSKPKSQATDTKSITHLVRGKMSRTAPEQI